MADIDQLIEPGSHVTCAGNTVLGRQWMIRHYGVPIVAFSLSPDSSEHADAERFRQLAHDDHLKIEPAINRSMFVPPA